ncbi:MAG: hypothetical protein ACI8S3_000607 [Alphaproteobacteria bacterium]|jgi:hypothetical protein
MLTAFNNMECGKITKSLGGAKGHCTTVIPDLIRDDGLLSG